MGSQRNGRRIRARLAACVLTVCVALTSGCTPSAPPQVPGAGTPGAPSSSPVSGSAAQGGVSGSAPQNSAGQGTTPAPPTVSAVLATGLNLPWSIAFLPDGTALVSERDTAIIQLVHDGSAPAAGKAEVGKAAAGKAEVGKVANVVPGGEGGLLGLAVADTFNSDHYVYAYYTSATDNRVVRMTYEDGRLGLQQVLLTGIAKANNHDGGRIKFGPDGFLYVGTGDALQQDSAQDRNSLNGKVLRITADGKPAPGNPFGNSPVYSYGHRNVQGIAWDSAGRLWISEFGPDINDELNLIQPGGNYGWPLVTGAPGRAGLIDAKVVWPSTADASPSGLAIVDDVAYLSALRGERLWQVVLHGTDPAQPQEFFRGEYGRLRDVVAAPADQNETGSQQKLWVLTNQGTDDEILVVD
ncbi:PQQ-dependent sugar dehydrogenase [Paenarthrobacter sp. PH39-S1]|uniref:PQQ-dependent sugar dehydrogenase n=1 Tax=Paenarthrobacter sp. PH39-S1 TaxID=3046204 RepID=UPI0024BA5FEB|nr:PQQ-dependent sugar dehydrogenase [Paenarthrobacter sp. PH39-S1]MDJ0356537.1 PQQ-dependent sugar dehydrogenase [Paenarthrobacter sp. PH39-S1]